MTKRLLLVDDEKFFLEGLKEGLSIHSSLFTTDICYSVNEAIELYNRSPYDLIVSDIRMPDRSGLELFVYLKQQNYAGGFIAMTAFGSSEMINKIKALGGLDILIKPFDFSSFEARVVDYFSEEEGVSGKIDSIALTSLLQMINLEKKTLVVRVEDNKSHGYLYFEKGEIVHAEYRDETGEIAAYHLIQLKKGRFSLAKPHEKRLSQKTIETPFMILMMNAMKISDESQKIVSKEKKIKTKLEVNMDIKKLRESMNYLKDQLGNGLVNSDIWTTSDGQSLVAHNSQPKAVALFNQLTQHMAQSLAQSEEDFVSLGRYYLIDLVDDHMCVVLILGDYQWGILFDKKEVQMGLLLNVVVPKIIELFAEAVKG